MRLRKNKKRVLFAALFAPVRLLSFWYGMDRLQHCALQQAASHHSAFVYWMAQPDSFWLTEFALFVLAWVDIRLTLSSASEIWRRSPIGRRRKKAAAVKRARLQLRQIEAGKGPDPLWVRFPASAGTLSRSSETPPDPELLAYLERTFMPFWLPLTPEARAAYLRWNPPPTPEWQKTMDNLSNSLVSSLSIKWNPSPGRFLVNRGPEWKQLDTIEP